MRAFCTLRRLTFISLAASGWDLAQLCARSFRAPDFMVAILSATIALWLSSRCRRRRFLETT
jgi:hypothetical protein